MACPKLYTTTEEQVEAARARKLAYYYHNRNQLLKKMKKRYAKKVGKESSGSDRRRKMKEPAQEPAPSSSEVTALARQIQLVDGQLYALTDNSIRSYSARVCKSAMEPGALPDVVEKALDRVRLMQDDVLNSHNVIYSAAGISKDWQDAQPTVRWFQRMVEYLEDMECHVMEGDLRQAYSKKLLAYQASTKW
ncbi:hypothetical protein EV421DRAFT_1903280 [Armillaria borealis]|uniref:Uncharacterized protein n=1 Tax=Armillaria borealis TaxID=47425 RepID=A0AA39JK04_9AGAR|nr:hypothetical protein EV421DRAFT_1903280 [Armillaria borealis]